MSTDDLIFWLREYAASRINSQLTDERRSIPPYIILDFGNRGLLGLQVQKQFGGLGLSQTDTVRVLEQVGAIDLTLATFLSTHANGVHTIQRYGCLSLQEELLPKFAAGREISAFALTEPCAGSNPQAIETRAVKIDQRGWVLNGEKYLVDSGSWASVITVFARTSGQETNLPNLSAFAVRQGAPGLVLGGEALTMGLHGMVQNALTLRDVHVAPESLLGEVGAGNAIIQDTLSLARLNLAAKSIGGMKRCLQLMRRYASGRLIATGILWNNPVTRSRVNQLVSAVTAVEALVRRIAIALDLGEAVPTEAFLACKVAGSEYLWKAADTLVQVLGGRGYVETNIAPQILRDARSFLLSEGPTETLLMYLGSRALEVGAELERFIAVALRAPRIAGQLREIANALRVRRASEALVENTAQSNRTYWTSWLMGEVAMWAILAAAVENDDISGHGMARAWVRTQLDEHIAALTNTRSEEIALSSGGAEAELIASYSASIGDIEQNMPAAVQEIDRYLIRDKAAVSVPVPHITDGDRQSYPKDVCIHHLFEQQVAQTPERLAVACAGEMLSYRELDSRADSLARKLREAGIRCGALVGLCVERSVDLLVSLLGILKAGAAYVPLDATHPPRRLAQILEETQMSVIVAHAHLAVRLPHHGGQIITPELVDLVNGAEREDTRPNADPNQLAYIMYTSGSTGAPKGVAVEHRSVVNFLCFMKKRPGFTADDVLVAVTPISFDIAGLELLLPVVAGGRVVLATRPTALDGVALTKLMDECGATVLQATPAMWQMLIASGWQGRRSLKALCGGESLSRELARSIQSRTASLWNLYGPTETTIWSCIEKVSDEPGPVSIGRPIANTQVYILNQEFAPVPAGLSGEIFIGGDGVAQGYWQRPDLTAERFLPDPFSEGGRIYRTGDLARHLPDGRIEYLGRLDHQVKIRGLRVELGEIEAALKSHDHVRQAVVVAHTYSPDDVRLIAYVVVSSQLPKHSLIEALQSHIRDRVPTYMLPSAFVVLDRLPLTANGKIDRNSLPLPRREDIVERHEDPSASDVERKIKKIWSKVLGVPTPHREDDFFVLGGHSLLATQVISQLRQSFGIELPIAAIFEQPTVAALTETVQAALDGVAEETTAPAIRTTEEIDVSSTQQRLWFLNQLDPKRAQYHVPVAFRLAGSLQVETLRDALQKLVERHDALRARFESRDGRPVQIVEHSAAVSLPVVDLVSIAETTRQAEMTRLIREEATRPFDLSAGPLLRVLLLQLAADHYVLLLTAHHIVADGWSMELLLRELGLAYTALASGRGVALDPLAIRYGVYLEQQHRALRGPVIESQLVFWRKHLADLPLLDLPTDCVGRREESDRGATLSFAFSAELSQALLRIGRRQGATTFVTLMAALQTFLGRHTGQDDFGIGFPIANRPSREVENLVGCFVNTLVLRADLSDDPPFTELLARVRSRALKAYAHQAAPYESLVQEFRRPLFRVMFALQNAPAANLNLSGIQIAPIETGTATAKFDLTFSVREFEGKLVVNVDYRTDLFEAVTIERMFGRFQMLAQGIAADPEQRISQLPLLMNDEKRRLLVEWNDTTRDCPKTECIHELFEAQAQRTPDAVAMVFEDHQLTYKELNERANQVAHYLRRQGVGPEVLVAICMERSLEMIIGLLGILKAGGAYVPLDPEYPKERLALMLADTQASVLLTQQLLVEDSGLKIDNPYPLSSIIDPRIQVVCLDRDWPEIGKEPPENGESGAKAENLAYVIYTSGSTGKPKGVLITHHNVTRLFESTYPSFHFNQNDVWTLFHSYTFDFSVWEIWGALLHGGRLVIVSYWVSRSPELFYDLLRTNNVTVLNQTPSAFHQLMQADESWQGSQDLALRWIVFGGEPLNVQSLKPWFDRHGDQNPRLVNMYGITETTVHVTYCPIEAQDVAESIGNCIGKQIPDLEIHILDQNRNLVPIGIPGELYVGGAGVARGYLNRPELTAERFVQDPFGRDPAARLYRTGDRARYLPDGNIEFLGRTDSQVKVRGYRVELGEIEAMLAQHPGIQQAVVLAREDADGGDKRLVAYVVTEASRPSTKELRDFLKLKLPDYMVPAAFVILGAMPLSANGKLDRKALPAPDQSRDLEHGFVAPRTPTEDILANIWIEVLKLDAVGVHDNFFELGGHSLLATRVVSRIRNALNCDLPLRTLFETPTLAGLAQSIQPGNESPSVQSWVPALRSNDIPLSFAQQRLWFLDRLDPDRATYNVPTGIRLRGDLNITALEQSLNEVIRRHEGLRTVFPTIHDNPAQKILPSLVLSLTPIDLSEYRENEREAALQTWLQQEAEQPFDLASGPLIRARLWHLSAHDHVLFLNLHHIVSDGWSMGLLFRELSVLYRAYRSGEPNPLAELPIQYADYAIRQRNRLQGENLDKQVSYWKAKLDGITTLQLSIDHRRPAMETHRESSQTAELSAQLSKAIKAIGRREGVTLFMTLLAAFQALLSRYTGQEDIAVGSPIAGRTCQETEGLIGFFVNTLVLRADLSGNPTFKELLRQVRKTNLEAYTHQDLPFEKLVEELQPERNTSISPLFQVMFVLQNAADFSLELAGISAVAIRPATRTAKFDLMLTITEREGALDATLNYNADLFQAATIERMLGHFQTLLEGIVHDPDQRISDIPLLTQAEKHQLLEEWNDTGREYPKERCIHQLFEAQAEKTPEAIAVVFEEQQLTYQQLNKHANKLARYLRQRGIEPGDRVGICLDLSVDRVVGLLGILKAGGAYLPLDPNYPAERLQFMLADAQAAVLLTQRTLLKDGGARIQANDQSSPTSHAPMRVIYLDEDWRSIATHSEANLDSATRSDQPAYVIYTSGSTGKPKGVVMEHRALANLIAWQIEDFSRSAPARTLQFASLSFDVSFQEMFSTWCSGGTLVLLPAEVRRDPAALLNFLRMKRVERLFVPFVVLQQMAEAAHMENVVLPQLREVITAGERLQITPRIRSFLETLPECHLVNQYGPTESHVVTAFGVDGPPECWGELPPIGRPIANTQIYILDAHLNPVPIGVIGEIYIGGDGVARGYLNRPELTAERFIYHSFDGGPEQRLYKTGDLARYLPDGNIEFLGRTDNQVKIRGYRIELGEIEAVLAQDPRVRESIVIAGEDSGGDTRLVAYIVPRESAPTTNELRAFLKAKLPDYMLPTAFIFLDTLPLTPNGKVDRKALPIPARACFEVEQVYVAPRNTAEQIIAGIWAEILGRKQIGVHDNFFDLGGHSLLATQVVSRMRRALQVEIPLRSLFEAPTVAGLAERIGEIHQKERGLQTLPLVPVSRDSHLPLSFAQQRLWFLDQLEPGSSVYNMSGAFRVSGRLDAAALERSLNEIVRRHETLRTTFRSVEGVPRQVIAAQLILPLPVIDLSDGSDGAREEQARRCAAEAARRPFDLSDGPLVRATLLRLGEEEHILLLGMHHIVSDGWSMVIFFRELSILYEAYANGKASPLPELPIQYVDYAVWQRNWLQGDVLETQLSYWRKQLENIATLNLPTDRPRPAVQTFHGARECLILSKDLTQVLKALSREEGSTLFMTLLAALKILLHRLTGQDDIAVGSPIAGRNRAEIESFIGFFINTLVLRTKISGDPTFSELLARVRGVCLEAYAHQDVPFEKLLEELRPERDLSRTPLFQVLFNMVNVAERIQPAGLEIETVPVGEVESKFDLTIYVRDHNGALRFNWVYNADLFDPDRIQEMSRQFEKLLSQISEDPAKNIHSYSLLTAAAQKLLPNPVEPLASDWLGSVHDKFSRQASCLPDHPAITDPYGSWTYAELNSRSNQLAHYLLQGGIQREMIVAVHAHRSASLAWALLGILKAGAAFLILDPAYPAARLIQYVRAAKPQGLINLDAAGALSDELEHVLQATVHCRVTLPRLSELGAGNLFESYSTADPAIEIRSDDLAYVSYTSGSTGEPKGVQGTHGPLSHFLPWQVAHFALTSADRFSLLSGLSHDPLHREIFTALWVGGTICVPDPDPLGASGELPNWMAQQRITFAHLTPALGRLVAESAKPENQLPSLRYAFFVGDKLTWTDIARLRRLAPHATSVNYYGSTETQRAVSYHEIPPQAKSSPGKPVLPVGRGMPDAQLLVLTHVQNLAGLGEVGEIYMRSPHLARGYLGDASLTQARFVANPFTRQAKDRLYRTGDVGRYLRDGSVEVLGRTDGQIKIRGFRVEPGEIEFTLSQHPLLRDVVVIAEEDVGEDKKLIAYLVAVQDPAPSIPELRSFLKQRMPDYMIPSAFVLIDSLPLTPNGKVDRRALPPPDYTRQEQEETLVAPRDGLELQLAQIWEKVLKVRPIGIRDNFFDLGGHSLLAVRLFAQIEKMMGKSLPVAALFHAPTIEQLARLISQQGWSAQWKSLVAIQPGGSKPPFFCVHAHDGGVLFWRDLARHLGQDQPFYALQAQGLDGRQPPHSRIEEMAAHYIEEIRTLQPEGPFYIGGHCIGGLVAFEMAQQLHMQGERVALLALFDSFAPLREGGKRTSLLRRYRYRAIRLFERTFSLHVGNLSVLKPEERLPYIKGKFNKALYKLYMGLGSRWIPAARNRHNILKAGSQAERHYAPRSYPGKITLFRATELGGGIHHDPQMGWGGLTVGGLETHLIPGYHAHIVLEPRVRPLAKELSRSLSEAQEIQGREQTVQEELLNNEKRRDRLQRRLLLGNSVNNSR